METQNTQNKEDSFFGKAIYSYPEEQAVEDGILMANPRKDRFEECSIITTNLFEKLKKVALERSKTRIFELDVLELMGCLMVGGKEIYEGNKFEGDNDKDFFIMPKTEEGIVVWFVKNENNKLTAMLPEDY